MPEKRIRPGTRIRAATPSDASAVWAIYAPLVADTTVSFETQIPSVDEIAARIERTTASLPWLVTELDDHVAGYAYATPMRSRAAYRWSVETSIYLENASRGRGLGRELYQRLLTTLTDLGYEMAYAGIALPNDASVGLHRALGFTQVGVFRSVGHKFGRWIDVAWWERPSGNRPQNPQPPRRWQRQDPFRTVADRLER